MPKRIDDTPAYRWPNTHELQLILSLLAQTVEKVDDKTCRYAKGWSDMKVARAVAKALPRARGAQPISHASVGTRRKALYGQLATSAPKTKVGKDTLSYRVTGLERMTDNLLAAISGLVDRVNTLEDLLTK